ncbi:nicotinate-nucleotide--dimethylbenzimidazole phosphoribosyltransferase [Paraglaciecola aquimarina]|uniref:Nicotinate-nucleotide--dimethylbenzimidazole phosphoribosyltransferase n=1 Tax=Paraglaciecola aquimarina TaxID=1235557 RepID=A0ABU3T1A6_9ALTE|nr:nicotinate-nucleotide--dimethylbenzimidazole phosphoribosyltransferase [Paraglaciecola aquimarina]MDU0355962.1 nicotinate-nucleotide--dimethylbenzimidazole phosphoribosyltransferase [Paraglaciecola aquimarina]
MVKPSVLIFAADHGIAKHPISIAPREVTTQMVANFLAGGAAINCFCNSLQIDLKIIDAGMLADLDHANLIKQKIAPSTHDFSEQAAMNKEQLEQAINLGAKVAEQQIKAGTNLLGFGEMGIGNSTTAAALLSVLTDLPAFETAGKGTGISDQQMDIKIALIDSAIKRVQAKYGQGPLSAELALLEVGGFEIAQLVGAMLATARAGKSIIVDGFTVSVAALLAIRIASNAQQFMLFAHCSAEQAHSMLLQKLNAKPLLNLGLRLGEGTGAALATPLIKAAAEFYNNMATLENAEISL